MDAFEVLVAAPRGVGCGQVRVDYDPVRFGRLSADAASRGRAPPLAPAQLQLAAAVDAAIEPTWRTRCASGQHLFDAAKFRFHAARMADAADDGAASPTATLCLQLGLTGYREYIGTNQGPHWHAAAQLLPDALASPLGNGVVVETLDGHVVLLRRSERVGESQGAWALPGGHAEPALLRDDGVAQELFASAVREVCDELGLVPAHLSVDRLVCIGIVRRIVHHRPVMFFHVPVQLTAAAVRDAWSRRAGADAFETVDFDAVPLAQARPDVPRRMDGCHCGGLALFALFDERRKADAALQRAQR